MNNIGGHSLVLRSDSLKLKTQLKQTLATCFTDMNGIVTALETGVSQNSVLHKIAYKKVNPRRAQETLRTLLQSE